MKKLYNANIIKTLREEQEARRRYEQLSEDPGQIKLAYMFSPPSKGSNKATRDLSGFLEEAVAFAKTNPPANIREMINMETGI